MHLSHRQGLSQWGATGTGNRSCREEKRDRAGQMWFPSQWTMEDIVRAGEHVSGLKFNRHKPEGIILWGTYKGVRVGIIKRNGQIQTIFPAENQPKTKGRR
nr:EndoU domain-containing protein [Bifidobacterium breve]